MKNLGAIEIVQKSFSKKMFGVDEGEVNEFLQHVAQEFEAIQRERNQLRESLRDKERQLADLKDRDHALQNAIQSTSAMSQKVRSEAEREAKLILSDASQRADIITRDSKDSLRKLYEEMADLKRARMQFEANLRAMAQAHLDLVEQGAKYMPSIGLRKDFVERRSHSADDARPTAATDGKLS